MKINREHSFNLIVNNLVKFNLIIFDSCLSGNFGGAIMVYEVHAKNLII